MYIALYSCVGVKMHSIFLFVYPVYYIATLVSECQGQIVDVSYIVKGNCMSVVAK